MAKDPIGKCLLLNERIVNFHNVKLLGFWNFFVTKSTRLTIERKILKSFLRRKLILFYLIEFHLIDGLGMMRLAFLEHNRG